MRKFILLFLLIAFSKIHAQNTLSNSLFWKISNGNPNKDSYIFLSGPVCEDDIKISPQLENVLKQVNSIAIEYKLYDSKDATKFQADARALTEEQNLRTNFSLAQYASFKSALTDMGMPGQMIDQFSNDKMYIGYYLLLAGSNPCGVGAQQSSYETVLEKYASKNKLSFNVLQTVDEYLAENNYHTSDYWKQNINYLLQNTAALNSLMQKEMDLYKSANIDGYQQLKNNKFYQLKYSDTVLNAHVRFIYSRIEPLLQNGKTLIVVDWSDFVFAQPSLIDLLKQNNYSVTPVTN